MSALEEYKETYNKFVTMLIDLHNTNVLYTRQQSFRNAADLRRILRQLKVVEKHLKKLHTLRNEEDQKRKDDMTTTTAQLQTTFAEFLAEDAKFTGGNSAAGTRSRKALAEVSKLVKLRRNEITAEKNARKEAKAAK
jgi:hypothetical protein